MIEVINKACSLDIHKLFFITTIFSRPGGKQHQCFNRDNKGILTLKEGILTLKNLVILEKYNVAACESTSDFWVPIYDSLIKHLPVIVGNARDMKTFTHKNADKLDSELIVQLALNIMIQIFGFLRKLRGNFVPLVIG